MRIGTWSATGLTIYNNYNRNFNAMNKAMLRISTGYRINSAADDPAGLAISEKMRAQIRGSIRDADAYAASSINLTITQYGVKKIIRS